MSKWETQVWIKHMPIGIEYPKWWQFWKSPKIIYEEKTVPK